MKIVEVTWVDSNMSGGWSSWESVSIHMKRQSLKCTSVGYLIKDDGEHVTLAMSQSWRYTDVEESASAAEILTIPFVAIENIRTIE